MPPVSSLLLLLFTLDLAQAQTGALAELKTACQHDNGALWGVELWGPVVLFDRQSRKAIANEPDAAGTFTHEGPVWVGLAPKELAPANTSQSWGGRDWVTVLLPLPDDAYLRLKLLVHESFHRVQKKLGLGAKDAMNTHLDREDGRLWLRMELRAVAQALRTQGAEGRAHARDALLFRQCRYALLPGAEPREAALEIQEGLAEYTGVVIALKETGEVVERVARQVEAFEDSQSYGRSFAYATGPALGLLLDRYRPKWRAEVARAKALSGLLERSLGTPASQGIEQAARRRAARYGYAVVARAEHDRQLRYDAAAARLRALLVDGPVLHFRKEGAWYRTFNPNNLMSLGDLGTVYPTGAFTSDWGKLELDGTGPGALVAPDTFSGSVPAPTNAEARPLRGPGWSLELAPGWTLRPGPRPGDFEIAPVAP
jgi:hypothetical protein